MVARVTAQTFPLSWGHLNLHPSICAAAVKTLIREMGLERQLLHKSHSQWWIWPWSPCPLRLTQALSSKPILRPLLWQFVSWGLVGARHFWGCKDSELWLLEQWVGISGSVWGTCIAWVLFGSHVGRECFHFEVNSYYVQQDGYGGVKEHDPRRLMCVST